MSVVSTTVCNVLIRLLHEPAILAETPICSLDCGASQGVSGNARALSHPGAVRGNLILGHAIVTTRARAAFGKEKGRTSVLHNFYIR